MKIKLLVLALFALACTDMRPAGPRATQCQENCGPVPVTSQITFQYENLDSGTVGAYINGVYDTSAKLVPVVGAQVTGLCDGSTPATPATGYTSASGAVQFTCLSSFQSLAYTITLRDVNNEVSIQQVGGQPYTQSGSIVNGQFVVRQFADTNAAWMYSMFVQTIPTINATFGYSRPILPVRLQYLQQGATLGYYQQTNDYILISTDPGVLFRDGPPTSFGTYDGSIFPLHEYGHAYMAKALDLQGICGGDESGHSFGQTIDPGCALAEGWADFFSTWFLWGRNRANTYSDGHYDRKEGVATEQWDQYTTYPNNGPLIENNVAAFFHDLMDNASTLDGHGYNLPTPYAAGDDSVAAGMGQNQTMDAGAQAVTYPGTYIGALLKTCQVNHNNVWRRVVNITDFIICMQHNPNEWMFVPSPFDITWTAAGAAIPIGYSEQATEPANWTTNMARAVWEWDLYHQPTNF